MAAGDPIYDPVSGNPIYFGAAPAYQSPSCCYRQSRKCSDGTLSGLWLLCSLATGTIKQGSICYYFDSADACSACPGTLHTSYSSVTSCSDAACSSTPDCNCAHCLEMDGVTPKTISITIASAINAGGVGPPAVWWWDSFNGTWSSLVCSSGSWTGNFTSTLYGSHSFVISLFCKPSGGWGSVPNACAIAGGANWYAVISAGGSIYAIFNNASVGSSGCPPAGGWNCVCDSVYSPGGGPFYCTAPMTFTVTVT